VGGGTLRDGGDGSFKNSDFLFFLLQLLSLLLFVSIPGIRHLDMCSSDSWLDNISKPKAVLDHFSISSAYVEIKQHI
jgi:hypothetical protein